MNATLAPDALAEAAAAPGARPGGGQDRCGVHRGGAVDDLGGRLTSRHIISRTLTVRLRPPRQPAGSAAWSEPIRHPACHSGNDCRAGQTLADLHSSKSSTLSTWVHDNESHPIRPAQQLSGTTLIINFD